MEKVEIDGLEITVGTTKSGRWYARWEYPECSSGAYNYPTREDVLVAVQEAISNRHKEEG